MLRSKKVKLREIAPVEPTADQDAGELRPPVVGDLGPNGAAVLHVLERAARLSSDERKRLADEYAWRAWPITLPAGGSLPMARALARSHARRSGRDGVVERVDAEAARLARMGGGHASHFGQAVADAALAAAVVDLVDHEVAERLRGAWRTVVH